MRNNIKLCISCTLSGFELDTLKVGDTITLVYSNECELRCDNPDDELKLTDKGGE